MIKFVFALICRIQTPALLILPILLFTITTPILFIICIKKKSKKPIPPNSQRQPPSAIEPTSPSGIPPGGPPGATNGRKVAALRSRQKPIVVFEDEISKSNAKTPKSKSVEEHSEKIARPSKPSTTNTSNSQKFDSSASVHEKDTVATSSAPPKETVDKDTVVAPPPPPAPERRDEDSVEDQRSEETVDAD